MNRFTAECGCVFMFKMVKVEEIVEEIPGNIQCFLNCEEHKRQLNAMEQEFQEEVFDEYYHEPKD